MNDIEAIHFSECERYQGKTRSGQDFYFAGKSLGVTAWGMNIIDMPPLWQDYPEHDHSEDGQEEVYLVLSGSGELIAGERTVLLDQGSMARVAPEVKRKLLPGPHGMTVLALGGTPGKAYEPPSWWSQD
jgi:uncharacterized cupin superfamily protein